MSVFYYSLQLNLCDCLLHLCSEMFLLESTRGSGGAWATFTVYSSLTKASEQE
jgi:hypothetical protein